MSSSSTLSAELLASMEAKLSELAAACKRQQGASQAPSTLLTHNQSADSLLTSSPVSSRASLANEADAIISEDEDCQSSCASSLSGLQVAISSNSTTNSQENHSIKLEPEQSHSGQAAMPRRSRSLVEDARADSQRNKQLLEELRSEQLACCDELEPALENQPEVAVNHDGDQKSAADNSQQEEDKPKEEEQSELEVVERCLIEFPRHISELDHCNHLLIKYEPELDPTHPGFHDLDYRARRKEVAQVAFNYKYGERIPEISYSDKEQATWKVIYLRLKEAYKRYACEQHNKAIAQLEEAQIYSPEAVPQLQAVSEFLVKKTGWRLRPVAGLLSARDFLASLAFRVFQTTQYIRHWGNPEHSVEPDCIHELMGHIPMLCDPEFAQFSQELGLASLGASDEQIERFATLYWFTVEFGLCQEAGQLKCYGAGLLSSYGEMEHALESGKPALKEFVPEETAVETYDDSDYQVVYYVARSFEEAKAKMRAYAANNLKRNYELAYDPYTCSVRELSSYAQLERFASTIQCDLTRLNAALTKLRSREQEEQQAETKEQSADAAAVKEPAAC